MTNKTDMLAKPEQLEQLIAIISTLNPLATVIPCQQGKVMEGDDGGEGDEVACISFIRAR